MSRARIHKELAVKYQWVNNPKFPKFRQHCWETVIAEWETLSIASRWWMPYTVDATNTWISQFEKIMAIGAGHADAFRDSKRHIWGVDLSQEIHGVARANCRLRGTHYTPATIELLEQDLFDAVYIDCARETPGVLAYVQDYHTGPILLVHKVPSTLQSLDLGNRTAVWMTQTKEPTLKHYKPTNYHITSVQTMNKAHSILELK